MATINFKICPIKEEIKQISHFLIPDEEDWDWREHIYSFHPKLKTQIKNEKNKIKIKQIIEDYVKSWFKKKKNINKIEKRKEEIKQEWEKIHNKFIYELLKILNVNKKKDEKYITSFISINPICPRNLEKVSFNVFFNYGIKETLVIIAHEITHFYYFDKWKETFPNSDKDTFEGPHIIWHLSEILAPVILAQPKIQKLLNKLDYGYSEYGKIKIGDKNIIEHFDELYKKFNKNKDFGDFLKLAYKEVLKYEKELINA